MGVRAAMQVELELPSTGLPKPWETDLAGFASVSLAEMDAVALLERRDTKYVLSEAQFAAQLPKLMYCYRALDLGGVRMHSYRTVYFDSDRLDLFRAHHVNRPNRYKVRSRTYVDSSLSFFEVKARNARQHTLKARTPTDHLLTEITADETAFIASNAPYPTGDLAPRLLNTFSRVTLVNLALCERLTFDFGLVFAANDDCVTLPGLVVAELKQLRAAPSSPLAVLMRQMNVHSSAFSKYCVGVSLLYAGAKHNRFNPQLRRVRRITGECDVE